MRRPPPNLVAILTALATAIAAFVLALSNDGTTTVRPGPPAATNVTVHVDGIDPDHQANQTITVPAPAVAQARAALESDLRNESPPEAVQAAPGQLAAVQDTAAHVKQTQEPLPVAGATQGFPGCRTSFVRNQSSRNGVRPIWFVIHYTVSPNRPGWSDVNAVVALFNTTSAQASSHFVIDAEGNCAYIVPIESKAWTEAAGNSLGVSVEVINSGSEASFMASPGYARLRQVTLEVHRRTGIPLTRGSVYPSRPGIVQHKDGGLPWGGHVDITPYSIDQVVNIITAPVITTQDRRACRKVHAYRQRPAAARRPGAAGRQHARLDRVRGEQLRCRAGRPVPA